MPRRACVRHVIVHVLRCSAFAGYRVALLSDFHFAPWQRRSFLSSAVDIVNAWRPDLIALGGDYGYSVRMIPPLSRALYRTVIPRVARELARLSAPDGLFAVVGNHDVDGGPDIVERELTAIDVRVLRGTQCVVARGDHTFGIVGIDDPTRGAAQFAEGLKTLPPTAAAVLLISHHPDVILHWQRFAIGCPVVVVAGHTHGGQITFPGIGAPITLSQTATRHFPAGFVPNDHTTLYVSRGLGEQVPIRVRAPREITLVEFDLR